MKKRCIIDKVHLFSLHPNQSAVIIILIFSVFFFLPYLRFDKSMIPYDLLSHIQPWAAQGTIDYKNVMMGDVILQFAPWHMLYRNAWLSGEIPFWNPYSSGGAPFLANHMSGVFYPLNLIFLVLPVDPGFTVFGIFHKFITGIGMYLLIRRFGLHPLSGLLGALTWIYSGYLTMWLPWLPITATLTWLPWAVLLAEITIVNGKWRNVGWLALVVALIFLGGHIQFIYYSYLTIAFFVLWRLITTSLPLKERLWRVLKIGIGTTMGLVITAIQLLPTLELSTSITREPMPIRSLMELAIPKSYLTTLFIPELLGDANSYRGVGNFVEFTGYIGLFGLLLIVIALIFPRWRERKDLVFFPLIAVIALNLVYGGSINLFMQFLPGYTFFRTVVRIYAIWTFAASVTVAIGVESILGAQGWRRKLLIVIGSGAVLVGTILFCNTTPLVNLLVRILNISHSPQLEPFRFAFAISIFAGVSILSLIIASRISRGWLRVILYLAPFLLISVDMLHLSRDYLPVVDVSQSFITTPSIEYLQEQRQIGRIARYKSGFLGSPLSPNIGIVYGLEDIDAYDSFTVKRYSQLVGAIESSRFENTRMFNQMFGFENVESLSSPIIQILRVAFLLSEKPIPELSTNARSSNQTTWLQVYSGLDMVIYRNRYVLPLAGVYGNYQVEKDIKRQTEILSDSNFNPSSEVLLFNTPPVDIDSNAIGDINILKQTYNTLELQVKISAQSDKSALLLITQNNYPGWRAQIDGKNTAIMSADNILQALIVPAGDHIIRLSFLPNHFVVSVVASLVSLVLITFLIIFDPQNSLAVNQEYEKRLI